MKVIELLLSNWHIVLTILFVIIWQIVRLTPTEKDDRLVKFIIKLVVSILTIIPDNGKTGKFKINIETILKQKDNES